MLHLNKFGTIAFAKNISGYLLDLNWLSPDNSRNGILESQQASYKITKNFVSESVYNLIDGELPGSEESNVSANLNEASTSSGQPAWNSQNILKNICLKNLNILTFAHLNINSIRNRFDTVVTIVNKNIDVFLISETKIDSSFPTAQFHIEGYTTPYRLDSDMHGGSLLLYI